MIGADERLVIAYQTQLDSDSQNGALLTNIAGVTRWYNDDSVNVDRVAYSRTLTDGTPGTLDHEDAHTVEVGLSGWFFEKTVENLSTGDYPATLATPGDTLRYSIRLQTTDGPLADFRFYDDLGELNGYAVFEPGTLSLVAATIPAGADTSNTDPSGGTNSAGIVDIRGLDLPAAALRGAAILGQHRLLLHRIDPGDPSDRLVQVDRLRAVFRRGQQFLELGLQRHEVPAQLLDLFLRQLVHRLPQLPNVRRRRNGYVRSSHAGTSLTRRVRGSANGANAG